MRNQRGKNLQLAGIELVLPTVLCIDARLGKTGTLLTIGYASGYADTIVAPLAAEWLSRLLHRRFVEHGRGAEGDLAAEAYYDKLAAEFSRQRPFLAAIVSTPPATGSEGDAEPGLTDPKPQAQSHHHSRYQPNGDALSRFKSGGGLVRWAFEGPVRAFVNARTAAAQVAFEPLPGGIEFVAADTIDPASAKAGKRANAATAWYGFGVPVRDPAEIVMMLRNEIAQSRHAHTHTKRAAHVGTNV
jgi:hypothetical protein